MINKNLPHYKVLELIEKLTDPLLEDFKNYLITNNKPTYYEINGYYPEYYMDIESQLRECFDILNKDGKYTKDIQSKRFDDSDRIYFYKNVYSIALNKFVVYKPKEE